MHIFHQKFTKNAHFSPQNENFKDEIFQATNLDPAEQDPTAQQYSGEVFENNEEDEVNEDTNLILLRIYIWETMNLVFY